MLYRLSYSPILWRFSTLPSWPAGGLFEAGADALIQIQAIVVVTLGHREGGVAHHPHELECRDVQISTAGGESVAEPVQPGWASKGDLPGISREAGGAPSRFVVVVRDYATRGPFRFAGRVHPSRRKYQAITLSLCCPTVYNSR